MISGSDKADYRNEINRLIAWSLKNNLGLNTLMTNELLVDFGYWVGDKMNFLVMCIAVDHFGTGNTIALVKKMPN